MSENKKQNKNNIYYNGIDTLNLHYNQVDIDDDVSLLNKEDTAVNKEEKRQARTEELAELKRKRAAYERRKKIAQMNSGECPCMYCGVAK
eukprot:Pgem_evm1s5024